MPEAHGQQGPVTTEEFRRALDSYEGETITEKIGSAVDQVWAAPGYRTHQRETVVEVIEKLYVEDNDVVLLSAPTGAGKSLLIHAVTGIVDEILGRRSFTTTPLNTLIDQIGEDDLLDDVLTIKGRNNYHCVHPQDRGSSVDTAICQRKDNFDCEFKDMAHTDGGCPYYGRKKVASSHAKVVTNLSFLMANSMIPDVADAGLAPRELLALDEAQNVSDFALMFVGVTVGPNVVPVDWDMVPSMPSEDAGMERVLEWLEHDLLEIVTERVNDLESRKGDMTFTQADQEQLDDLRRFVNKATNLLTDVRENHWTRSHETFAGDRRITFQPVFVGRFLEDFLWSQCNRVLAASATIPPNFVEEVGLDDRSVARVEVPSTFPPERRPVITTESVGKMSYQNRDRTLPKMADQIARLADLWDGHRGFVHCHSYRIAERIYDRLPRSVQQRTRLQDGDDREGSLQDWLDAPVSETGAYRDTGGQVFLSVAMDEGISLDDELTRWQVVAKAAYPHMQDERVSYRMDSDTMDGAEWDWYASQAAVNLQQAVGRGMRSKDDWCATYLLDDSAIQLIERNEHLFEDWFLDAVDVDHDEDVVTPENGGGMASDEGVERGETDTGQSSLDDIAEDYFG